MDVSQLPVFRKMYDLNILIIHLVDKFQKLYKYSIGEEMIKTSLGLFKHLISANRDVENRVSHLDKFLDGFDLLKVYIRLVNENKMISLKEEAKLALITESISKQIIGWKKKSKDATSDL